MAVSKETDTGGRKPKPSDSRLRSERAAKAWQKRRHEDRLVAGFVELALEHMIPEGIDVPLLSAETAAAVLSWLNRVEPPFRDTFAGEEGDPASRRARMLLRSWAEAENRGLSATSA